ncbi:MAG: hypothetical protein R3F20_16190 [Planctomycetota bacterium]
MKTWERVVGLFREGKRLEAIKSGWRLDDKQIAEAVVQAHRAGEQIDPAWLLPPSVRDRVLEVIDDRPELGPTAVSSLVQGKVPPDIVRALRVVRVGRNRVETKLHNEVTFFENFHDDLAGAKREILIVAREVKGKHWRRHIDSYTRLVGSGGVVAIFSSRVSDLIVDAIKDAGIVIIEKDSNANLALIDGEILWEGSMNFLLPPAGDEHVRRTLSRLQCDEVKDLNDLFV